MIADNLKRIEELRYKISEDSFKLMKLKNEGESGNRLAELDSEINSMKLELANHLSFIQDAGYVYIFVNKKEIEKLKQEFTTLSKEDKDLAFKGFLGKGYEILQKSNSLLKNNFDNRDLISTLIISLPSNEETVSKIKNVLEGYSEKEEFSLENAMAAKRISSLINSLGFFSTVFENKVTISRSKIEPIPQSISPDMALLNQEKPVNSAVSEVLNETIEEVNEIPASEIKKELTSEDLQPSLTYKEVCEKLDKILNNYKMKRWVLGAFKDEEEKKQYEKIQITVVKLMRLKQEMEEKKKE